MIAAVRIRGRVGVRSKIADTMQMLKLKRKHNCVILPEDPGVIGMLRKVAELITWGEINLPTLTAMLRKRGRCKGRLDREFLVKAGYKDFGDMAKDILAGKVSLKSLGIKQPFKLTPPSKGFKRSVRQSWPAGELGYRGEKINELLMRMI